MTTVRTPVNGWVRRRTTPGARALVLAALWLTPLGGASCAPAGGAVRGQPPADSKTGAAAGKEAPMSDVVVAVTILKTDAIAGESFPVRVALMNHGGFPIAVHSGLGSSPLAFQVLSKDGAVVMNLSDAETRGRTQPDRAPAPRPQMETLAQGQGKIYEQDAFRAALEPLAPGSYQLVALYRFGEGRWKSDPVPFILRAPTISALAAIGSPATRTLAWVLADSRQGNPVLMFARESLENVASAGVSHRFASLAAGAPVSSAAIAEELGEWQGARWSAWMRDGKLGACLSAGEEAFVTIEPLAIGLDNASLLSTGRQQDSMSGTFLAAGTANGKARLKEFTVQRGQAPAVRELSLPALPDARSGVCFERGAGGDVTTHVVMAVPAKSGDSLALRSFGQTESGDAGTTRTLVQGGDRVVAIGVPVVVAAGGKAAVVTASADLKAIRLFAAPFGGGGSPKPIDIPAPALRPGESAASWAVGPADGDTAPVLLITSLRVLALTSPGGGWAEIGSGDGASRPQIAVVGETTWAVWASARRGVLYERLESAAPPAPADEPEPAALENPR